MGGEKRRWLQPGSPYYKYPFHTDMNRTGTSPDRYHSSCDPLALMFSPFHGQNNFIQTIVYMM